MNYILGHCLRRGHRVAIPQEQAVVFPDVQMFKDQLRNRLASVQASMQQHNQTTIEFPPIFDMPEETRKAAAEQIKAAIGRQHGDELDECVTLSAVEILVAFSGDVFWLKDARFDAGPREILAHHPNRDAMLGSDPCGDSDE